MPRVTWNEQFIANVSAWQSTDFARVFGSMHSKLLALGFTQTSDTGQLATFSMSAPSDGQTIFGYRVYAWPAAYNSLHATDPLFLKVTFRSALGCTPAYAMEIGGPSTDGAGNLTNAASGNIGIFSTLTTSGALYTTTASVPSHIIIGDGYIFFAMYIGALTVSTNFTVFRPNSPDHNLPLGWCALGRAGDTSGTLQGSKLVAISPTFPTAGISTATPVGYSTTISVNPITRSVAYGQSARTGENFTTLLLADGITQRDGSIPVGRCYADFGNQGVSPIPWIGAVCHEQWGNGDTTSLALIGSTPRNYIHLSKSLMNMTSIRLNTLDSKSKFTTPIIQWDGVNV